MLIDSTKKAVTFDQKSTAGLYYDSFSLITVHKKETEKLISLFRRKYL